MRLSSRFNKIAGVLAAIIVVTIGYVLFSTNAGTTYGSLEPEEGTLTGGATVANDSAASGGKYVLLTKSTSSGGGGTGSCTISSVYVNSCRPWLSATVGGYPQASGGSGSLSQMQFFNKRLNNPNVLTNASAATTIKYKMDVPHTYHTNGTNLLSGATKDIINDKSLVNDVNAPILVNYKPGGQNWAATAAGNSDAAIIASAKAVKAVAPKKIILSLWHEMENTELSSTGLTITGGCKKPTGSVGSAADYRAMYRHVHDVFKAQGVTNVAWGMNYMGYSGWDCAVNALWPGNDVVDWVLWDSYGGASMESTFARFYNFLEKNTDATHAYTSKPWGLAETGTHEVGTTAVNFWKGGEAVIGTNWNNNKFPRIKLISVFDTSTNGGEGGLLRVGYDNGVLNVAEQTAYSNWAKKVLEFNGGGSSGGGGGTGGGSSGGGTTTPTPDTTKPVVTATSPSNGATVGGTITITGTATDNVSVKALTLRVDNKWVLTDETAPYSFRLDTKKYSDGNHTFVLRGFDPTDNMGESKTITVKVNNATGTTGGSPIKPQPGLPPNVVVVTKPTPSGGTTTVITAKPINRLSNSSGLAKFKPVSVGETVVIEPTTPGAPVDVQVDGMPVNGTSIDTTSLTDGTHTLTITENGHTRDVEISVNNPWHKAIINEVKAKPVAFSTGGGLLIAIVLGLWLFRSRIYYAITGFRNRKLVSFR